MKRNMTVVLAAVVAIIAVFLGSAPGAQADAGGSADPSGKTSKALSGPQRDQVVTPDGASCFLGCSQTLNQSGIVMTAFRNWCEGGITSSSTTTRPTCSSDGVPQSFITLSGSGRTPDGQDWDGFQVDAGWCYKVFFASYLYGPFTAWYNRSNLGNLYVKVGNDATAYVQAQRFGSCP